MSEFFDQGVADRFDFVCPLDAALIREDPFYGLLIGTNAFQRLKNIRFLGGIDYFLVAHPNGQPSNVRYTRFQHSAGVARLALHYSAIANLSTAERRLAFAVALLHDIGHAPLSHSVEPVFEKYFNINHHLATKEMIMGSNSLGREVFTVLKQFGVDPHQVCRILSGEESDPFDALFSGPINIDTIEGILRSHSYIRGNSVGLDPFSIVSAVFLRRTELHMRIADEFWQKKDTAYKLLVRSRDGVIADHVCRLFVEENMEHVEISDFFSSEVRFFKKIPGLRKMLHPKNLRQWLRNLEPLDISFVKRQFLVNSERSFFSGEWTDRYRQIKSNGCLSSQ